MGQQSGFICRKCGERFTISTGGGFVFDLLRCDQCGAARSVSHQELGEIHLGFVKGLPGPYAVARSKMDREIKEHYRGTPLSRDEYHAAAEASLDPCTCGGRFRYHAPARCPACRSTRQDWDPDPTAPMALYD